MRPPAAYHLVALAIALMMAATPERRMTFAITSTAFVDGATIPRRHTCDGEDASPPLGWSGAPVRTAAFALIVDDPDAPVGTWVHWVLYNVPPTVDRLPEGVAKTDAVPDLGEALQGRNDFRRVGYGGPCPPPGAPHHYYFKLYALDSPLTLKSGAQKRDVETAMHGHTLEMAQLVGTYGRQKK